VLNERTNVNKLAGKEPWRYIEQYHISEEALRAHLIPQLFVEAVNNKVLLEKQWSVERFTDFLIDRAQLLAQETNAFLYKLRRS